MSSHYRIVLLSLSFFSLSTLTHASPYPQWGSRHRQGPAVAVTNTGSNAVVPPTNDGSGGENTITTVTQGGGSNPTAVPNTGNPPTADNPSTDTGNGRRGLAYDSSSPSLDVFANSDVTWVHNWNSAPGDAPSSFTFVPTLWSDQSPHSDNWAQNAAGHQYLMSFNEPDIVGQANMEVGAAVAAFQKLMIPLRSSTVKIGAPSVSSGSGNNEAGIPMGTGWLRQFLESCNDPNTCVVDFVCGHWYGCPGGTCSVQNDVDSFNGYVTDLVFTAQGRDVWIPEFQRYGDMAGQKQFLEAVLPTLDSNNAVKRYAYFMVADGILTTNGQVNDLGAAFAG